MAGAEEAREETGEAVMVVAVCRLCGRTWNLISDGRVPKGYECGKGEGCKK